MRGHCCTECSCMHVDIRSLVDRASRHSHADLHPAELRPPDMHPYAISYASLFPVCPHWLPRAPLRHPHPPSSVAVLA